MFFRVASIRDKEMLRSVCKGQFRRIHHCPIWAQRKLELGCPVESRTPVVTVLGARLQLIQLIHRSR
jgi:hypothetical protein